MKTTRIPHAPGTPLPELAEFLAPFRVHFHRSEGPQALERYLTGLLTEHPNKNCDTIAQVVPGTSEQRLHGLLTAIDWDEDDLNRQRVQDMLGLPTEGDGVLIFDDTGFAKQGRCSVGVAGQYSGTLGKVGNCQVTVNCHYAERTIAWPVATRLYLPESWAHDADRRAKAKVPEEVTFPRHRGVRPSFKLIRLRGVSASRGQTEFQGSFAGSGRSGSLVVRGVRSFAGSDRVSS